MWVPLLVRCLCLCVCFDCYCVSHLCHVSEIGSSHIHCVPLNWFLSNSIRVAVSVWRKRQCFHIKTESINMHEENTKFIRFDNFVVPFINSIFRLEFDYKRTDTDDTSKLNSNFLFNVDSNVFLRATFIHMRVLAVFLLLWSYKSVNTKWKLT